MQGRRLPDAVFGERGAGWDEWRQALRDPRAMAGIYMKVTSPESGIVYWHLVDPYGHFGTLSVHDEPDENGNRWEVTEHEDGAITVSPSIWDDVIYAEGDHHPGPGYHGYLQHGVWTQ